MKLATYDTYDIYFNIIFTFVTTTLTEYKIILTYTFLNQIHDIKRTQFCMCMKLCGISTTNCTGTFFCLKANCV